jgi:hypothetical protein
MIRKALLPAFVAAALLASCTKEENKSSSCTLSILKSPTGQHQSITANIDNNGYTNIAAQTLLASGGTPLRNYNWSVEASPVPPSGYIFWPLSGIIDRTSGGTAANGLTVGTKTFKVKVSDGSCSVTESVDIIVTGYTPGPAAIFQQLSSPFTLKTADANKAYGASLFAMGGTPPYSWALDPTYAGSTDLTAAGLLVDPDGGIVRGTVTSSAAGKTIKFKVKVTDATNAVAVYSPVYTIVVN